MTRTTIALARRSLRQIARRPQFAAPLIIFPTLFLAINVGGMNRTTELPGFPEVNGFLDFQLAAAMTQSLLLGAVSTGIATALEIEGGFFDRLVASPIPRSAIVAGRILAAGVVAIAQIAWFLAVGLIFGAEIEAGVSGVLVVLLIGVLAGIGFGAIGVMLALRAKNASTVQGMFPLIFVILFVSSAFFPADLLHPPADWLADINPLSYIADGLRKPVIDEIDGTVVLRGVLSALGIMLFGVLVSLAALRGRLREA